MTNYFKMMLYKCLLSDWSGIRKCKFITDIMNFVYEIYIRKKQQAVQDIGFAKHDILS